MKIPSSPYEPYMRSVCADIPPWDLLLNAKSGETLMSLRWGIHMLIIPTWGSLCANKPSNHSIYIISDIWCQCGTYCLLEDWTEPIWALHGIYTWLCALCGLSAPSYGWPDSHKPHTRLITHSQGSQHPHEHTLTFPCCHEVCNRQTRLMSASRHICGLATTHIILYLVYNTHAYLICPTYPPQQTRECLTSTLSRLTALICQRVPRQCQPTSAAAY